VIVYWKLISQVAHKFGHRLNLTCGPQPKWRPYVPEVVYEQPRCRSGKVRFTILCKLTRLQRNGSVWVVWSLSGSNSPNWNCWECRKKLCSEVYPAMTGATRFHNSNFFWPTLHPTFVRAGITNRSPCNPRRWSAPIRYVGVCPYLFECDIYVTYTGNVVSSRILAAEYSEQ